MTLTAGARKLLLTAHITASVGWIGALAVFLAHAAAGLAAEDTQTVRALSIAMGLTAWFVILPLSAASLVTGIVQAVGTAWGLVRHYWVLFKLVLTVVATGVLLLKLGPIGQLADAARETAFTATDLVGLRTSLLLHAAGGVLVLLAAATLAIFKPQGTTRFGRAASAAGDRSSAPTPPWVKWSLAAFLAMTLALIAMMLPGGHGPGAHTRPQGTTSPR
jgi:hypothetical protein